MSSFGSPGGASKSSKPIPPERGSFPLDHDAECQPIMKKYLLCLKGSRGINSEDCRGLSKAYLQCRMERNLMAPDSMRNLGFAEEEGQQQVGNGASIRTDAASVGTASDGRQASGK